MAKTKKVPEKEPKASETAKPSLEALQAYARKCHEEALKAKSADAPPETAPSKRITSKTTPEPAARSKRTGGGDKESSKKKKSKVGVDAGSLPFEVTWKNFDLLKKHFKLTDEETHQVLVGMVGPCPDMEKYWSKFKRGKSSVGLEGEKDDAASASAAAGSGATAPEDAKVRKSALKAAKGKVAEGAGPNAAAGAEKIEKAEVGKTGGASPAASAEVIEDSVKEGRGSKRVTFADPGPIERKRLRPVGGEPDAVPEPDVDCDADEDGEEENLDGDPLTEPESDHDDVHALQGFHDGNDEEPEEPEPPALGPKLDLPEPVKQPIDLEALDAQWELKRAVQDIRFEQTHGHYNT